MASKRIIGITASCGEGTYTLNRAYADAVIAAGGTPMIIVPGCDAESAISACDGIILSGGGDIEPERFGLYKYDASLLSGVTPERDELELALARLAYERDIPTLAICRGIQVLNVALGGTLYLDIPGHRQELPRPECSHTVDVMPGSQLARLTGTASLPVQELSVQELNVQPLHVNSFHHQCVAKVAPPLMKCGLSPDGCIEALEAPSRRFMLGVQWHPEHLTANPAHAALFRALVEA